MKDENVKEGKLVSAKGFANENRFLGALLERGYNASKVDLPHSTYDILVEKSKSDIVRVQVKTVSKQGSVSFRGGARGGVDRTYKPDVKTYIQNTETSDIVVGVRSERSNGDKNIDYYFIPTIFIERINQQSISINKIPMSKNYWELLSRCKDSDFVVGRFSELLLEANTQ